MVRVSINAEISVISPPLKNVDFLASAVRCGTVATAGALIRSAPLLDSVNVA